MKTRVILGLVIVLIALIAVPVNAGKGGDDDNMLTGYKWRKQFPIDGSTAGVQTDYQMKLTVHRGIGADSGGDVYLNNRALKFPDDVKLTESDGETKLDYWVEEGSRIDYFVDSSVYGARRPGGFGVYDAVSNKTFVVYLGADSDPYITYYDHATQTWAAPVECGDSPAGNDSHYYPMLLIDDDGYLYVFYGCHNSTLRYTKSDSARDITAWTDGNLAAATLATYPFPVKDDSGNIYVFYRYTPDDIGDPIHRPLRFVKTADGGANWDAAVTIWEVTRADDLEEIYLGKVVHESAHDSIPEKFHLVWCISGGAGHDTDHRNLYYAYFKVSDNHMYDVDDTDLGVCIDDTEGENNCLVVNTGAPAGKDVGYIPLVAVNSTGYPILSYHDMVNDKWITVPWNGSAWNSYDIVSSANLGVADMEAEGTNVAKVFIRDGNDLEYYKSSNWGETWALEKTIYTTIRDIDGKIPYWVNLVTNYNDDLKLLFKQADTDYVTDCRIYAWSETVDAVWCEQADIWIEFNSIPADPGSGTFYIYYGKTGDASESSGANTWDDFRTYDTDPMGEWSEDVKADNKGALWTRNDYSASSKRVRWKADIEDEQSAQQGADVIIGFGDYTDPDIGGNVCYFVVYVDTDQGATDTHCSVQARGGDLAEALLQEGHTYIFELRFIADTRLDADIWEGVTSKYTSSITIGVPDATLDKQHIYLHDNAGGQDLTWIEADEQLKSWCRRSADAYLDKRILWWAEGKFCYPEPTWGSWGSEESLIRAGGSNAAKLIGAGLL